MLCNGARNGEEREYDKLYDKLWKLEAGEAMCKTKMTAGLL